MTVNSQLIGRVLSVQKILVGGIEQTPEGDVADGKVTPYMLIRGSTGNSAIVDASGNLVCMLKGSENLPIAQDVSGNLVAVMKGNYGGALKTWKVDDEGRGEMFLNDPSDVWGNINPMGLGEAMVRTHAPPMVHDKRGNIVRWIDFESATPNYDVTTIGSPTYGRSPDTSFHGDFSHKSALANGDSVEIHQVTNDFDRGNRRGISAMFATADSDMYIEVEEWEQMSTFGGALVKIRYDLASGDLSVYGTSGWAVIDNLAYYHNIYNFSTIKMVVSFQGSRMCRAVIFGREYDLSAHIIVILMIPGEPHLDTTVRVTGTAAGINTIYLDNIMMTENEPEN